MLRNKILTSKKNNNSKNTSKKNIREQKNFLVLLILKIYYQIELLMNIFLWKN